MYYLHRYFRWVFIFYHALFNTYVWRPGRNPKFYRLFQWADARFKALEGSDYSCQTCGRSPSKKKNKGKYKVVLTIDHKLPLKDFPWLCVTQWNLGIMCKTCNRGKGRRIVRIY